MLQILNLTISLSKNGKKILDNFTFSLNPGDKAVIIGEEGNGKSTLLKLIYDPALVEHYIEYSGNILRDGLKYGYLKQELSDAEKQLCVREFLSDDRLFETLLPDERAEIAAQLGLNPQMFNSDQSMSTLSGGEKVKMQMARILAARPDVLLLDEPTNDIDIKTLEWLETYINRCGLPVLFVSHDETLIERTANVIIHLEQVVHKRNARHTIARMPYAQYIDERMRGLVHQEQVARKQREDYKAQQERWKKIHDKVERDQENISRQDPGGARLLKKKMKAVKSLEHRFEREKEDFEEIPIVEEAIFMKFAEGTALPRQKEVLRLSLPELKIGSRILSKNIELNVSGGEHVGIIGDNGTGKTTLLRLIADELLRRKDLKAAYMPQDYEDSLDLSQCPLDFLAPSGKKEDITRARIQMGSMRFTHEEMLGTIGGLSGGQKAKLLFLKMTLDGSNVLILDEPTRNFSPLSNPVIRRVLRQYDGTIISVTHDRKYLAGVCDTIYEVTPEGLFKV
ncbi:MAG TPA: ATP-binding cassette domain-containing protein [Oscillospiraceae bacterium]|nr:ATP-binding cassette domain-containing protein [Oscillospiraceae bacterium]HPF56964.1 ATP-binding cassette domain-containing protein [Clostridiales bacterium]HPK35305.1 ATP-binding cassette domain-containing protein [Oscillospiraceae bacterium]HPR76832.1 ATP-binding cassette domain-containing protein [Oscillospiraceae bacterium]